MVILIESDVTRLLPVLGESLKVIIPELGSNDKCIVVSPKLRQNAVMTSMAITIRINLRRNSSRCSPIVISTGKSIADGLIPQLTNIIVPRSITSFEPFTSYAERAFNNLNYISLL